MAHQLTRKCVNTYSLGVTFWVYMKLEFKLKNRYINVYQFEIFAIKVAEKTKKIIRKYVIFFIITSNIFLVM